jgi:hypothetical protein
VYIEFKLPQGAGGQAAIYVNSLLNRNLQSWSDRYGIPYSKKIHKYSVRVTFNDENHYPFFALTWAPDLNHGGSFLLNYRFVEPMNRV